jgi:hypothetical protein
MLIKNIIESMTLDRIEWRKIIHVADPDYSVDKGLVVVVVEVFSHCESKLSCMY